MTNHLTAVGLLFSIFVGTSNTLADARGSSERPNIVLICLEGIPAAATGFGGNPHVKTPNLDRLAADSARFTRAYTPMPQSAGCRASLLTGQYPHVHKVDHDNKSLSPDAETVSRMLEKTGYTGGLVGTWRLPQKEPTSPGPLTGAPGTGGRADVNVPPSSPPSVPTAGLMHPPETPLPPPSGLMHPPETPLPGPASAPAGTQPASSRPDTRPAGPGPASRPAVSHVAPPTPTPPPPPPVEKPGLGFKFSATSDLGGPLDGAKVYIDGKQETADKWLPDWHTDQAVKFIRESKDKRFFLAFFLPGPREPLDHAPGKESLYAPASLPLPSGKQPDPKNLPPRLKSDPLVQKCPKQPEALRQSQSKYYSFVSHTDENVGRVLTALEEAGVDDRTLIVLTSDQGFATGDNGAWGMGPAFWEELIRCPLLIRPVKSRPTSSGPASRESERTDPASFTPARIDRVVSLVDIAPTLLEVIGLATPRNMQGRSLLPLIRRGEAAYHPDECFVEYEQHDNRPFPARVLVSDQYKLVDYLQDSDQFYDLKRDPDEQWNLVDDVPYAAVVKVMRSRLEQWRKKTKDGGR